MVSRYLLDPANDETITMSGYEYWDERYELRRRAHEAVESHLMQIVNRTKPMDQAEGLAILAALDGALLRGDYEF